MTFVAPIILEELMNKLALWISIRVNDRTTERAIIANNDQQEILVLILRFKSFRGSDSLSTVDQLSEHWPP